MSRPIRVQLRRAKDWRMPPNTVSVARPGRWGNPFDVSLVGRERAVSAFRDLMSGFFSGPAFADLTDAQFKQIYDAKMAFERRHGFYLGAHACNELYGKNLACWCALDQPCHADVLLEFANGDPS